METLSPGQGGGGFGVAERDASAAKAFVWVALYRRGAAGEATTKARNRCQPAAPVNSWYQQSGRRIGSGLTATEDGDHNAVTHVRRMDRARRLRS